MKKNFRPFSSFLALLFYFILFLYIGLRFNYSYDWFTLMDYSGVIFKGWYMTVLLSLVSMFFSLIFGFILFLLKKSSIKTFEYIGKIFTEFMFGSPLLVLVVILYYIVARAFYVNDKFIAAVIILTLYNSSYVSEIYRGGIENIPEGQWKAARVYGFTNYQTYRHIILPQVLKTILPPLTGQMALMVKSTALLSYMAVNEFFNTIMGINSVTFAYIEGYIFLALGYLIITIPISMGIKYMERKLQVIS
ncbi:MAG: amino acid ABC transporter permease [bacterium]